MSPSATISKNCLLLTLGALVIWASNSCRPHSSQCAVHLTYQPTPAQDSYNLDGQGGEILVTTKAVLLDPEILDKFLDRPSSRFDLDYSMDL